MGFKEYQEKAVATAIYGDKYKVLYPAMLIAGEAGEIANKIQKIMRDKDGVLTETDKIAIGGEIGDVLWGLAALSRDIGISLDDTANNNIQKLLDRQARGVISGSGDNR